MAVELQPPPEEALVAAVRELRVAHPELGVTKLLAQLKSEHADWAVSEKRFRRVLQPDGAAPSGTTAGASSSKPKLKDLVARTGIDATINIAEVAPKVEVKMFGGTKGKGLVAKEPIEKGEVLWQEEPWIACPDPELRPHLTSGAMCTHCLALISRPAPPMSQTCPHCTARFCNRLCLSRSPASSHHPLLCPGLNPAADGLARLVATHNWRALDVVARIVARWRLEREAGESETERRTWQGTARVNMEKRMTERAEWPQTKESHIRNWQAAHAALVEALNPPSSHTHYRAFAACLASHRSRRSRSSAPLTPEEEKRWFSYDSFLELLGLANINMEDSGGLYALHAHMNHSCEPNISVRNLPKAYTPPAADELPTELPPPNPAGVRGTHKLTILARHRIEKGEELVIPYVDFRMPRGLRRDALREGYGFWCACPKCKGESGEQTEADKS